MLFQDPQRTQYDVNFQLTGIPVRVHPWFWVITLFLGLQLEDPRRIFIWVVACFVSILVHEFGHALTIRFFGWQPSVVLYSFGGLATYNPSFAPAQHGRRRLNTGQMRVLISLAGPAAGFLLAALVLILLAATSHDAAVYVLGRWWVFAEGANLPNASAAALVEDLLYINIYWGILNLLPIYPLDGGQVARELFLAKSNDAIRQSLMLSFATAAVIAGMALIFWQRTFLALMFGYLAYMNYTQLSGPHGGFGGPGRYRRW